MKPSHRLILASAGTGKTYRLAGQFLRILLRGVPPERILATTFTRKAAGEILDRVLRWLLDAIEKERERFELASFAGLPGLTSAACLELLQKLVQRLDRLQVRTLDSFFVQLARIFSMELGLPLQWRIASAHEQDELHEESVALVLQSLERADRVSLLRSLRREAGGRSVHKPLLDVVRRGLQVFYDSTSAAWQGVHGPSATPAADLALLGERLQQIHAPRNKDGSKSKRWQSSLDQLLESFAAQEWGELLDISLVKKAGVGEEAYDRKPIEPATREVLQELGRHASAELLFAAARETQASRAFLEQFVEHYSQGKHQRGLARFEDLPYLLAGGASQGPLALSEHSSDLWFRLDGQIDHILLDEFQDTAPLQFRALAPLAEEILADGTGERSFFCVGDYKQSIYGWRSAEPRLLKSLSDRYPVLAPPESLTTSYRSSAVVLDTVNRVFSGLHHLDPFQDEERPTLGRVASRWATEFPLHTAATAAPGACVVWRAQLLEEESIDEALVRLCVERLCELERSFPSATIGVLMRRKKWIPRLLHELCLLGISASGEGSSSLLDSEPVQVFLSALHLADHPGDSAAAFHISSSPLAQALGFRAGANPRDIALSIRTRLIYEGYGAFTESLYDVVRHCQEWGEWDRRRFRALVDYTHGQSGHVELRPERFAAAVRQASIEDSSSARIRIMTIHRSKGLEFDVALLPDLNGKLLGGPPKLLSSRKDPFGCISLTSVGVRNAAGIYSPEWQALSDEADERRLEEELCVLYVGMTRARRRLELFLPPLAKSGKASVAVNFARIVESALCPADGGENALVWQHPDSSDLWAQDLQAQALTPAPAEERPLRWRSASQTQRPFTRSASQAMRESQGLHELFQASDADARLHGSLVHRLFQECIWLDLPLPSRPELLQLLRSITPDLAQREAALSFFHESLSRPAIREMLTRPGGSWQVERECRFSVVLPDADSSPSHWAGSIDRLVVELNGKRALQAQIFDYKTNAHDLGDLQGLVAKYKPQLELYRRVVSHWMQLEPSSVRASLVFLCSGTIVPV